MIASRIFFTKGVGVHKEKLGSFEAALRDAKIQKFNLVHVSSIFPPYCKIVSREKGLEFFKPGEIVFCVMARNETNEPNRLISASIGLALPKNKNEYGYLSEHHDFGMVAKKSGDYAEDLAATMLASTLGIDLDPQRDWDQRKKQYKASGKIFRTSNITQSAEGNKDGLWTTVISSAVLIMEPTTLRIVD